MAATRLKVLLFLMIACAALANFGCAPFPQLLKAYATERDADITQNATPAQWGEYRYHAEYRLKGPVILTGEDRFKNSGYGQWFIPHFMKTSDPIIARLEAGRTIRVVELRRIGTSKDYELYVIGEVVDGPNAGLKGVLSQLSRGMDIEGESGGMVRPNPKYLELVEVSAN